jgi:hypothetical protein
MEAHNLPMAKWAGSTNCFEWKASMMSITDDNMSLSIMLLQNDRHNLPMAK